MNQKTFTYTEPKRILVTGGAGFLGSHLCDRLLADGNEVQYVKSLFIGRIQTCHGTSLCDDR